MSALAAMHVAKRQLGLDEDTYRAVLVRVTGKDSAKAMTEIERERVIEAFRKQGFQKASKSTSKGLSGPYAKKLQALWIAAWNLGLVRDRTDAALTAFVKRQTGLDAVRFLRNPADAARAIEALKGWIARDGGVDWSAAREIMPNDQARIAWAQFRLLVPGATVMGNAGMFRRDVLNTLGAKDMSFGELTAAQWQIVMNAFGNRIREARAA